MKNEGLVSDFIIYGIKKPLLIIKVNASLIGYDITILENKKVLNYEVYEFPKRTYIKVVLNKFNSTVKLSLKQKNKIIEEITIKNTIFLIFEFIFFYLINLKKIIIL